MTLSMSAASQNYFHSQYGSQAPWVMEAWEKNHRREIQERRAASSEAAKANLIPLGRAKHVPHIDKAARSSIVTPLEALKVKPTIKKPVAKTFESDRMKKLHREFLAVRNQKTGRE